MNDYAVVEYRPGRWAKVNRETGSFLGPASSEEVIDRQTAEETRVEEEQSLVSPEQPDFDSSNTPEFTPVPQPELDRTADVVPETEGTADSVPRPNPGKSAPQKGGKPSATAVYPVPKRFRVKSSFRAHLNRRPPSKAPGVDIPCPRGTEIRAWAKGRVIRTRYAAGGGRSIWILHGGGIKSYYAHLRCAYVLEGETVRAGQKVGECGTTGRSSGPHLHFSIVRNGKYVDPARFLLQDQVGKA